MFYEVKVKVSRLNERGEEKEVTEQYILQGCETFTEAEMKISEWIAADNLEYDVFAITRSNVGEIVNEREGDEPFFKAKIIQTVMDDNGNEKGKAVYRLVCAKNIREANANMETYMAQSVIDTKLESIVKTKILELIL